MIAPLLAALLGLSPGVNLAGSTADRLEALSRAQLQAELVRVRELRPRLAGPIFFIPTGAALAIAGLVLLNVGAGLVFSKPALVATFLIAGGAVLVLGGIALALIGIVQLGRRLAVRAELGAQADAIEKRLDFLERSSHHGWLSTVVATF